MCSSTTTSKSTALLRRLQDRLILDEGISLEKLRQTSYMQVRGAIGPNTQVVLIGEATHGTQDFYEIRAEITKLLIEHEGFDAVICEGDFPPFFEMNRFVGGAPHRQRRNSNKSACRSSPSSCSLHGVNSSKEYHDKDYGDIGNYMEGFKNRFPEWMWRNNVTQDFVLWLREYNSKSKQKTINHKLFLPVQVLGLDIYSMFTSVDEVVQYLGNKVRDMDLAKDVKYRYCALNEFRPKARNYAVALYNDAVASQEENVSQVLATLYNQEKRLLCRDIFGNTGGTLGDGKPNFENNANSSELFNAMENARVVAAAEAYYRQSFMGGDVTWNVRDAAFLDMISETLSFIEDRYAEFANSGVKPARVVVWAHNSHVGDARYTSNAKRGRFNLGQLCRQKFGVENVYIVGFSTHDGSVRAATSWGGTDHILKLNPSIGASHENVLHEIAQKRGENAFGYTLRVNGSLHSSSNTTADIVAVVDDVAREVLKAERLQRFVGVNYLPATELQSHYFLCNMSDQFDFILHVDRSFALRIDGVANSRLSTEDGHRVDSMLPKGRDIIKRVKRDIVVCSDNKPQEAE